MSIIEARTFDPTSFEAFRFGSRRIDPSGEVTLGYALDDRFEFTERFVIPPPADRDVDTEAVQGLLALLHWVVGVSYFKTAIPKRLVLEGTPPSPAAARFLEAIYSEGLGEFAVVNELATLPRPKFPVGRARGTDSGPPDLRRVLVPIGGGKDSVVALEIIRQAGLEPALFSVGDAEPIARTAAVAGLPRLIAQREIDPQMRELNQRGALNGHVPVTAIIAASALLTAELHGFDAVAFANERSASSGNLDWHGVTVNHQFSKSARAESLLRDAVGEIAPHLTIFSVLRPASELAISRAFARLPQYHHAFTSCNRVFRIDPSRRSASWCCDCPKCRFVFLIMAPFVAPDVLHGIFGSAMLEDLTQFPGFALLAGVGGHKPFECVGSVDDSVAAIRMLAADPIWKEQAVVRRLVDEVLPQFPPDVGVPAEVFELSAHPAVPAALESQVHAILGS